MMMKRYEREREPQQYYEPPRPSGPSWKLWAMITATIIAVIIVVSLIQLVAPHMGWWGAALANVAGGTLLVCIPALPIGLALHLWQVNKRKNFTASLAKPTPENQYPAKWHHGQWVKPEPGPLPMKVPQNQHYAPTIHQHNDVSQLLRLLERMQSTTITQESPMELTAPRFPGPRDFTRVLEEGFRPSRQHIYLLDTVDGPIAKDVYGLTHIGLGGPTGGGKTTTSRLMVSQLLTDEVNAQVYLASPNFAPVKLNGNRIEDWRPIMCRLAEPPAQEAQEIRSLLKRFLLLFEKRKKQEWQSLRRGDDVFLVLGEWPGIVARVPEAADIFKLLLRESRQYGIHLITEMQDALVKTIGVDSGCRDNLRTGYYYGGDATTARVLLNLAKGETIDETGLGQKGAAYLRTLTNKAVPGRVPFLSNAALYMLLGSPPDPMPDGVVYEGQIPERYSPVVDGRYVDADAHLVVEPSESDSLSRQERLSMPAYQEERQDGLTRQTGPLSTPVEPAHNTSELRYRLSREQEVQFKALYRERRNIDYCLKRVGASSLYREHARQLIQRSDLAREE